LCYLLALLCALEQTATVCVQDRQQACQSWHSFFETQCSFIARTGQVGPVQSSSTPKRKRAVVSKKRGEQKRARYFQQARDSMYQRVEASETLNGT